MRVHGQVQSLSDYHKAAIKQLHHVDVISILSRKQYGLKELGYQWIISVYPFPATMKNVLWFVCLCVVCVCECWSSGVNGQEGFMLLAGPLNSNSEVNDAFDCSHPIPPGSRQYFEYLQSRGVTHFKVPLSWAQLLPTGLPSQPHQAVVTCYQTLLRQLLESGLQPLVVLHGSTVPEALRSRFGGWESQELGDMFQQYAEFAFQEFGELGESWVTLSDLGAARRDREPAAAPRPLQNILQLHRNIYKIYHQRFPEEGV